MSGSARDGARHAGLGYGTDGEHVGESVRQRVLLSFREEHQTDCLPDKCSAQATYRFWCETNRFSWQGGRM